MTKLFEWICALLLYIGLWLLLLTKKVIIFNSDKWDTFLYCLPVHSVILFGLYAVAVIMWRVYTFNDCPEAAEELQQQIKAAKEDLKSKGLKF